MRTIALDPILKFQMKGLGYGHPQWGQACGRANWKLGGRVVRPASARHAGAGKSATCSRWCGQRREEDGIGVLEQICIGP